MDRPINVCGVGVSAPPAPSNPRKRGELALRAGIDADVEVVRQLHEMRHLIHLEKLVGGGRSHPPHDLGRRTLPEDHVRRLVPSIIEAAWNRIRIRVVKRNHVRRPLRTVHADHHVVGRRIRAPGRDHRLHVCGAHDRTPHDRPCAGHNLPVDVAPDLREVLTTDRDAVRRHVQRDNRVRARKRVADRHVLRRRVLRHRHTADDRVRRQRRECSKRQQRQDSSPCDRRRHFPFCTFHFEFSPRLT